MKNYIAFFLIVFIIVSLYTIKSQKIENDSTKEYVFSKLKDEFKLAGYFLNTAQKQYYKKLDKKQKWQFLKLFWESNDPNPITPENEFLVDLIQKINYCNAHFSHFKEGWKTDIGRVYLRYGEPFEIIKGNTSVSTKHVIKEYQIWKYRIKSYSTYIFLNSQMNGNFRLIYSEGDEKESSIPDWESYLGSDFDYNELE
ncbi:MAG: GWxTD domain-containing protein [Candidatus Cloacimonetes bacterium]|nr:GWxTD domain-containing protein [Candidatus Cloacimonadota bacterium]